jgi:hypothetical protein
LYYVAAEAIRTANKTKVAALAGVVAPYNVICKTAVAVPA